MTQKQDNSAGNKGEICREEALDRILRRIKNTRDFPVISKYLIEINQKLSDGSAYTTASELANIIIKDYALTNKLLKLVNSAFYGVVAGKVTTISRAVILLGYNHVRLAAGTLVLFEHFQSKSSAADMKEAVIHSFWCGLVAKEIAAVKKLADPEEAFICAMLHELGRLLTILHMPREFKAIKLMMLQDGLDEKKAAKAILGVSYDHLGKCVARTWGFPEKIRESMGRLSTKALQSTSVTIDPLHAVAAFVNQLGYGLMDEDPGQASAFFVGLCKFYKGLLAIDKPHLDEIVQASLVNVRKHADALGLTIEKSRFLARLESYCEAAAHAAIGQTTQPAPSEAQIPSNFHLLDINMAQSLDLSAKSVTDPIADLIEGLQEVICTMAVDPDVNNVALMVLEIIYRSLKFDQVILFINDTARQVMEARYSYGCDLKSIVRKAHFRIETQEQDIFCLAINLSQDLIVEDTQDAKLRQMIPQWYQKHFKAAAFVFFPILYKHVCLGAIYADRKQKGPPISALEHQHVGILRNQMILALKYCK